jgi:hypothetical protein
VEGIDFLDWRSYCSDKIITPEEAVANINRGSRVFIGTG